MIVAEYLASLLAVFNSTAATFTGTGRFFCLLGSYRRPSRAIDRSTAPTAIAFNVLCFICPLRLIWYSALAYLLNLGG